MLKMTVPVDLLDPDKEGELFFAQRVAELTYSYSKESYRASTTTVPFLARECLSAIQDHLDFDLHISGVERVLDELKRRSFQNSIVNKILGNVPLDSYFEAGSNNISRQEDHIRLLCKQIHPVLYIETAISLLKLCKPVEKIEINFLAGEVICGLINLGISQEYLYEQCIKLFFQEIAPYSGSRTDAFIASTRLKMKHPTYVALVPIISGIEDINSDVLNLFRTELRSQVPSEFSLTEPFPIDGTASKFLLVKNIDAPDHYAAAKFVKRTVVRIHDLLGLFFHKGTNEVGRAILVALRDDPHSTTLVKLDRNIMQQISDNPRTLAARKLEAMVKTVRLPAGDDGEKFFRVVDFHGMSLNSAIPENQLINLWTSLETIAPSIKGKSIIGSVCDGVVPFLGLQYSSRLFLNLARDFKRWDNSAFKKALKDISAGHGIIEKTFHLVVNSQYAELCKSLLAQMDDFPLLKFRIFELNKKFKNGKIAKETIALHTTKATQQLHRIYRARNSIVHSAKANRLTENLIVSAHEYFDQVFSQSIELCSKPMSFDNYRDAFSYNKLAFASYMTDLGEAGASPVTDASVFIWTAR